MNCPEPSDKSLGNLGQTWRDQIVYLEDDDRVFCEAVASGTTVGQAKQMVGWDDKQWRAARERIARALR